MQVQDYELWKAIKIKKHKFIHLTKMYRKRVCTYYIHLKETCIINSFESHSAADIFQC